MSTGNTFGRFVHVASAALPAAGAYTAQTAHKLEDRSITELTFHITYTRGAAGGYPQFKIEWGNGTEAGISQIVGAATVSGSTAVRPLYDEILDIQGLHPSSAAAVTSAMTLYVPRGVTTFRLLAAEVGVVGTPGTCAIAVVGGSGR